MLLQLAGIVESGFCLRVREIADTGQSTSSKAEPRSLRARDSGWHSAVTSALSGSELVAGVTLVGQRCATRSRGYLIAFSAYRGKASLNFSSVPPDSIHALRASATQASSAIPTSRAGSSAKAPQRLPGYLTWPDLSVFLKGLYHSVRGLYFEAFAILCFKWPVS